MVVKKTLVMVCGANRSGTTMLDLILGNGEGLFSCGEVYNWFRPTRKNHFSLSCSNCGEVGCSVWSALRYVKEHQFHESLFSEWGYRFVIDSSKNLCWVLDSNRWARKYGTHVCNLLIWKNPIDLAYSFFKRGFPARAWRDHFVNYYAGFFSLGLPFTSVSYDDFVRQPEKKLSDLCELTGIPYFRAKERFWEGTHHHLFGSGGTRKQVEAGASEISRPTRPPEFEMMEAQVRAITKSDPEVARVLEMLDEGEISRRSCRAPPAIPGAIRRPPWYYWRMLKMRMRRYYPAPAIR